jgi:hypothetical protein
LIIAATRTTPRRGALLEVPSPGALAAYGADQPPEEHDDKRGGDRGRGDVHDQGSVAHVRLEDGLAAPVVAAIAEPINRPVSRTVAAISRVGRAADGAQPSPVLD